MGYDPNSDADALVMSDRWRRVILLGVLLLGVGLRVAWVGRPLDHRLANSWREADYAQIARNYFREDGNLFYPRIDWRGDTPGYVESELPALPWLAAQLYGIFGYDIVFFRALSASLGVAALLIFAWMAHRALPQEGALFAVAAFALNPYLVRLGNSLQPEPLVILLSLIAVGGIWRWAGGSSFGMLLAACAAAAGAMLAKMSSAYLGLVFACVVLRRSGLAALRDVRVYVAAALAVVPPLAWSLWARHFWTEYGNSLGVSNETHLITWKSLIPPSFLIGNIVWETLGVWTPAGWLLGLAALRLPRARVEPLLVWYGAVWCFYIAAANTSGDQWANYYHSASVAPASLLMGAGVSAAARGLMFPGGPVWLARRQRSLAFLLAAATLLSLASASAVLVHRRDTNAVEAEMFRCSLEFERFISPDDKIIVGGGVGFDDLGQPVAGNNPLFFAWMDRRGFSYTADDLSVEMFDAMHATEGMYWIARQSERNRPDLARHLKSRWPVEARCGEYTLHRIDGTQ